MRSSSSPKSCCVTWEACMSFNKLTFGQKGHGCRCKQQRQLHSSARGTVGQLALVRAHKPPWRRQEAPSERRSNAARRIWHSTVVWRQMVLPRDAARRQLVADTAAEAGAFLCLHPAAAHRNLVLPGQAMSAGCFTKRRAEELGRGGGGARGADSCGCRRRLVLGMVAGGERGSRHIAQVQRMLLKLLREEGSSTGQPFAVSASVLDRRCGQRAACCARCAAVMGRSCHSS